MLSALPHEHTLASKESHQHELSEEHEQCLLCTVHISDSFTAASVLTVQFSALAVDLSSNVKGDLLALTTHFNSDRAPPYFA